MKLNIYPVILLLICSLFVACKKDIVYENDFERSERAWSNFKAASGNSYRYMVSTSSWTGSVSETTVTVNNGTVIGRSYLSRMRSGTGNQLVIRDQWEENIASLGSHQANAGPFTLDDIYQRAKSDWLKKREDAKTYFEANNNGMISHCGYVVDGCVDDCFIGITITYIEKL